MPVKSVLDLMYRSACRGEEHFRRKRKIHPTMATCERPYEPASNDLSIPNVFSSTLDVYSLCSLYSGIASFMEIDVYRRGENNQAVIYGI